MSEREPNARTPKTRYLFLLCWRDSNLFLLIHFLRRPEDTNIALLLCVCVCAGIFFHFVYTFSDSKRTTTKNDIKSPHSAKRVCEDAKKTKVAQSLKANALAIVSTFLSDCYFACNISQIKILTWRNQNSGALVQVKNGRFHYTSLNARSECAGFSPATINGKKEY